MTELDLLRPPDLVAGFDQAAPLAEQVFSVAAERLGTTAVQRLSLRSTAPISRVLMRWQHDLSDVVAVLPDAWERSYGDLFWRPVQAEHPLPWSFLARTTDAALGAGVRIGAGALCFWTLDAAGLSLWADVRCGGAPVQLGERTLVLADVVSLTGADGESAFAVQQRLDQAMAQPVPGERLRARLPGHPVYGGNDWHYAMGNSTGASVLALGEYLSACAPEEANRPYLMVDDGWSAGGLGHGPWIGRRSYGHMGELAGRLRSAGVRPGLWYRPLTPLPEHRDRYRSARDGGTLDPSIPEVLASVAEQVARISSWGYELIKHDFTIWDTLGRWGFQMGADPAPPGWAFADRTRTTAEILTGLYSAIREASGSAMVMGCNAFGHLVAGHAELQRIGDDASGTSWNRTRRMAINSLAFRAAQHGALYAVDADVAPITPALPWRESLQWLHLLSASGTPAFVSVHPDSRRAAAPALRDAFTLAARPQPLGEPLDQYSTTTPTRWWLGGRREQTYDWYTAEGGWPFGD